LLPVLVAVVPVVTLEPLEGEAACVLTRFTMNMSGRLPVDMPLKRTMCEFDAALRALAAAPPVEVGQSNAWPAPAARSSVWTLSGGSGMPRGFKAP
jgi:hypothetical protein